MRREVGGGKMGRKIRKRRSKYYKCEAEKSSLEERNKNSCCSYGATRSVSPYLFTKKKKKIEQTKKPEELQIYLSCVIRDWKCITKYISKH